MDHLATWNGCSVYVHQGDIAALEVDVIVNAANQGLWTGGGVCGAIHRKAGKTLADECAKIIAHRGSIPAGEAVITSAGALLARHVIHAVGPVYLHDPKAAPRLLASTYQSALGLARTHGLKSIAFPCISTGAFGYPQEDACRVAVAAVRLDLEEHGKLEKLVFCTFAIGDADLYRAELKRADEAK